MTVPDYRGARFAYFGISPDRTCITFYFDPPFLPLNVVIVGRTLQPLVGGSMQPRQHWSPCERPLAAIAIHSDGILFTWSNRAPVRFDVDPAKGQFIPPAYLNGH